MDNQDWNKATDSLPNPDSIIEVGLLLDGMAGVAPHPYKFKVVPVASGIVLNSVDTEQGTNTPLVKSRLNNYTHWRYVPDAQSTADAVAARRALK